MLSEAVFDEIRDLHAGPDRGYHGWSHPLGSWNRGTHCRIAMILQGIAHGHGWRADVALGGNDMLDLGDVPVTHAQPDGQEALRLALQDAGVDADLAGRRV